jgi:YD repeat-containing protein
LPNRRAQCGSTTYSYDAANRLRTVNDNASPTAHVTTIVDDDSDRIGQPKSIEDHARGTLTDDCVRVLREDQSCGH